MDTVNVYYPDGTIKAKAPVKEGKKYGLTTRYYPNGIKKEEVYFINNKPFGHAYYYHQNGQLDTYSSFDFKENARYVRKYNESGDVVYDKGTALGQLLIYDQNDSIKLRFTYAKPPSTEIEVSAIIYDVNSSENLQVDLYKRIGEIIRDKQSIKSILIIGKLKDTVTNNVLTVDSLFYPDKATFQSINSTLE
ncbi:MAG: toxin-antitoxin system YwqK family antitoxin [Candidatus Cyclobacteriaceae bacterium M2_1C_046]